MRELVFGRRQWQLIHCALGQIATGIFLMAGKNRAVYCKNVTNGKNAGRAFARSVFLAIVRLSGQNKPAIQA